MQSSPDATARYFGTTPELRLNMQRDFDLENTEIESGERIATAVQPRQAA